MLGSVLERGMEITPDARGGRCARRQHLRVHRFGQGGIDRRDPRGAPATRAGETACQKLIVSGCMSQRFSRSCAQSLPEVDAFIGLDQVRELGAIIERVVAERDPGTPSHGRDRRLQLSSPTAADLHSRLGYAAFSAHPGAQRLPEDRRGLQSSVQFLCHPANARPASQPSARVGARGGARARRRGREGNQSHQPGHDLLRNGFVGRRRRARGSRSIPRAVRR